MRSGLKEATHLQCITEEFEIVDMYIEHTAVTDVDLACDKGQELSLLGE
jgi:hypothetical protein